MLPTCNPCLIWYSAGKWELFKVRDNPIHLERGKIVEKKNFRKNYFLLSHFLRFFFYMHVFTNSGV